MDCRRLPQSIILIVFQEKKDILHPLFKEFGDLEGEQRRGNKPSLLDGNDRLPRHAHSLCQVLLSHVILIEPAAF